MAPGLVRGGQLHGDAATVHDATGIEVNFQPTPDYETVLQVAVDGGNAPDLAQIAQPGKMHQYAERGSLVTLDEWFNTDKLAADMVAAFFELGITTTRSTASTTRPTSSRSCGTRFRRFADNGYEVPTTWEELVALSDQIIADGNGNPWCISIESQEADGWVATDWMEDILLRTAPPETYQAVVRPRDPVQRP